MSSVNPSKSAPVRIQRKPRQLNLTTLISQGFADATSLAAVTAPSILHHTSNALSPASLQNALNNNDVADSGSASPTSTDGNRSFSYNNRVTNNGSTATANQYHGIEPLKALENLELNTSNGNYDSSLIKEVYSYLKTNGQMLDESPFRAQLDQYFNTLRNVARDDRIDAVSRAMLLELVELRSMNWVSTDEFAVFYERKLRDLESYSSQLNSNVSGSLELAPSSSVSAFCASGTPVAPLAASEIIKPSGKFSKPAKVPGKNYVKDEFVIRNSDSGKVNAGAKERLLQITGPNEDSITRAKHLIEDTIKRNASPVPEPGFPGDIGGFNTQASSSNSNLSRSASNVDNTVNSGAAGFPHMVALTIGTDILVITSSNVKLAEKAKVVLEKYLGSSKGRSSSVNLPDNPLIGGYEASESSDSEVYSNKAKNTSSENRSQQPLNEQASFGYQLSRQTSFHTSSASKIKTNEESKKYLQRSASQGSFLPGRTSMRYFNADFKVNSGDTYVSDKIIYDRNFLIKFANTPLSNKQIETVEEILTKFPEIARNNSDGTNDSAQGDTSTAK